MISIFVVDHFTLEELGEVEYQGQDYEGTDEVDDVISLSGRVLLSSVVVQRVVDLNLLNNFRKVLSNNFYSVKIRKLGSCK